MMDNQPPSAFGCPVAPGTSTATLICRNSSSSALPSKVPREAVVCEDGSTLADAGGFYNRQGWWMENAGHAAKRTPGSIHPPSTHPQGTLLPW